MSSLEAVITLATLIVSLIAAVVAHFITIGKLKDKIHDLELRINDLHHKNELQQKVTEQLKEIFPIVKSLIDTLKVK